ncbi:MAG: UDP-N-acetylglucosamine 2-epimerase [Gemmatimonadetes bacterium]|nr:UDP-N-acetylglucosamine 2-epimerase [Gemmatimonadota bacterium]
MKVLHIVGSQSGFFRLSPVFRALRSAGADRQIIIYSGHREELVPEDSLLQELELPSPDHVLGVSTGSSASQTGRSLIALEPIVVREAPDWIFAVGDADVALAAALVGRKNRIPVAHLEAGLRAGNSGDAIDTNRLLTDRLSDALFVAEVETRAQLLREGIDSARIHFVGNTVADAALRLQARAAELDVPSSMDLERGSYVVGLLTRVDTLPEKTSMEDFLAALDAVAFETGRPTVLILDASSARSVKEQHLEGLLAPVMVIHAPSYLDLLGLAQSAGIVVTNACEVLDSATMAGVPTIAICDFAVGRTSTRERDRHLSADELVQLPEAVIRVLKGPPAQRIPDLWDGHAAQRIAEITMAGLLASVA